jgi:hypothetical protein
MSKTVTINKFFSDIAITMAQSFQGWEQDNPHPGEQGGIRERRVADFLRRMLPKRYGIGTGHIIDSNGTISSQVDIIIYDAIDGIHLPLDSYYSLFPCESVCATIEVKSTLSTSTITDCVRGSTKIFNLARLNSDGKSAPIPNFIFAYNTGWQRDVISQLKRRFEDSGRDGSNHLPEMIFVLQPEFLLATTGPTGYNIEATYRNIYRSENLAFIAFFSKLLGYLQNTKARQVDLWEIYAQLPTSILGYIDGTPRRNPPKSK